MSGSNDAITNTGGPASSAEPSMEEILASIRRILKDDQPSPQPEAEESDDDILVLDSTMVVKPEGYEPPARPAEAEPELVAPAPILEEPAAEPGLVAPAAAEVPPEQPHLNSEISELELPAPDTREITVEAALDTNEIAAASLDTQAEPDPEPYAMEAQNMSDQAQDNVQPPHGLVSEQASEAAAGSIGALIRSISSDRQIAIGRVGLTLEDLVREELRPLLKGWLDSNLPALVERIVRAEIQRVIERTNV